MKIEDYKRTQPYLLGLRYRKLAETLMDPKTDIRDLCDIAGELGCRIALELVPVEEAQP